MSEDIATREAYGLALKDLGAVNDKVVVLDADLSGSTKTSNFAQAYPDRFFDMGIAETNMTNVAAGMAACGKIPFIREISSRDWWVAPSSPTVRPACVQAILTLRLG